MFRRSWGCRVGGVGPGVIGSWGATLHTSHLPPCASHFLLGSLVLPGVFSDVGQEVDLGVKGGSL